MMSDTKSLKSGGKPASGRFVLRIDPELHGSLRREARTRGLSLNEYCARKLSVPHSVLSGPGEEAIGRAVRVAGDSLVGVVAFGSWAREEMVESSDVDLFIVVENLRNIDRGLYRSWDESPVFWGDHPLEPHFVHLPEAGARLTGLWAEVALDGVVLFERDLRVSTRLVEFRRQVAAGRILLRRVHGQSYWVGEA